MPRDLDSDEKMMDVAAKLRSADLGFSKRIECPYCGGVNDFGGDAPPDLCCDKFAYAAVAYGADAEIQEQVDVFHRIEDRAALN